MNIPSPDVKTSLYFNWHEMLWLPSWSRMAQESDGLDQDILDNLNILALKMDVVRKYFNAPIIVHCCYRPEAYNQLIGGAPNSAHKAGQAIDFNVQGIDCDRAREIILKDNKLQEWSMRMENRPGSDWLHLGNDWKQGMNYYFIP